MEPEISTRCQQCGAAVRPHTLFCPECGQPADKPTAPQAIADNHREEHVAADDGSDTSGETPVPAETVADHPEQDEPDAVETVAAQSEASAEEAAEPAKNSLSEHLAKLKDTADTPPVVIVDNAPRKSLKRRSSSSSLSTAKKSSKGRLIWSRFPSLRRVDEPRPGRIDPGLRFLIVAAVLTVFALAAYYFSRFLR